MRTAFAASLLPRLCATAVGLLVILRVYELRGSFVLGGLAAGAGAAASACAAPLLGRLADRRGQRTVLGAAVVVYVPALTVFALLGPGAPGAAFVGAAAVGGAAMPQTGVAMRALWPRLLPERDQRDAAYAMDATTGELLYIAGPLLLVSGVGALSIQAGLLAVAVLVAAGTGIFIAQPVTARRGARAAVTGGRAPLRSPGLRLLAVTLFLVSATISMTEIAVPAALAPGGEQELTGAMLALWGVGSLTGGVLVTRRPVSADPVARLWRLLGALALVTLPLALAGGTLALAMLLVVAGLPIAPVAATTFRLADRTVEERFLTETFGWIATAATLGFALGSPLGGALAERLSPSAALGLAALPALLAAAAVRAGAGVLR